MSCTPIADMIETMFAAGAPLAAILVAVRTLETSRDASRTVMVSEPSKAALRAKRYRENLKQKQQQAKANDVAIAGDESVTMQRDASRDGVTARCDLSSLLTDSQLGNEEVRKKEAASVVEGQTKQKPRVSRGTRITAEWQPSAAMIAFARDHHVDPMRLRDEFVDYWIGIPGQRGTKSDWDATWRNRVRAVGTKNGGVNGSRTGRNGTAGAAGPAAGQDAVLAGMGRAFARRFGNEPAAHQRDVSGGEDAAAGTRADDGAAARDERAPTELELIPPAVR